MPEYLAPGVYVEETSFRPKSIEGVSTSTTAFVGPTLKGPHGPDTMPELLTSFGDFERIYGGLGDINGRPNYIAHAVRAYFDNEGSRLYVSRVVPSGATAGFSVLGDIQFEARFAGEGGNGEILLLSQATPASETTLRAAPVGSLLRIISEDDTTYYLKSASTNSLSDWENSEGEDLTTADLQRPEPTPAPPTEDTDEENEEDDENPAQDNPEASPEPEFSVNLITLSVVARDAAGNEFSYENLGLDPRHPRWIASVLPRTPARRSDALSNPFALAPATDAGDLAAISGFDLITALESTLSADSPRIQVQNGSNGGDPGVRDYELALEALESLDDISIVAAPGHSAYEETVYRGIQQRLITFVSRRRAYQIAVLDTPLGLSPTEVRNVRSQIDSDRAALYYPWVVIANPLARPGVATIPAELTLPPSGFICGIYARNDAERGVYKAPANEVVRGALRFEREVNSAQQDTLNPIGINCLRFFPGRGYRVWGARTASSDPEWKYVSDRRYFNYLERSIDQGTQWAVFEPNGPRLWANIRDTIGAFLYNEWVSGALLGSSQAEAFFVRCDRSTMTQNDLDNGRLICLIGVATQKPAEFVIFRIGQKTADMRG